MSMNNIQKNVASTIQNLAMKIVAMKGELDLVVAMYTAEGMSDLTDADYAELSDFAHVTVVEMTAAKGALDNINTTFGGFVAGTNVYKLMKIVTTVPKG